MYEKKISIVLVGVMCRKLLFLCYFSAVQREDRLSVCTRCLGKHLLTSDRASVTTKVCQAQTD